MNDITRNIWRKLGLCTVAGLMAGSGSPSSAHADNAPASSAKAKASKPAAAIPAKVTAVPAREVAQQGAPLALTECYGVSHPDQLVFFDDAIAVKPASGYLTEAGGGRTPFQKMSDGRLALRTDLPAGQVKSWSPQSAHAGPVDGAVTVTETDSAYELSNGMVAVRVPKVPTDFTKTPAPLQGLQFQDKTWTAQGPNFMSLPAKSMKVEFLDKGPLDVRVKISYVFAAKAMHSIYAPRVPDVPAGDGPFSTVIELQAGQPSVLIEDDSEVDISYRVDITNGLAPDRAQYRGHHATDKEAGANPDGSLYAANDAADALVNLNYAPAAKSRWSGTTYPYMAQWDPWAVNSGFYWQLYDSKPGGGDNLLGIFAGPASHLINPGMSGVSFDTQTEGGKPVASMQVRYNRFMPTQYYSTHLHCGWGIFLGKKSADLKPVDQIQGVQSQLNLHSGFNLTKIAAMPPTFPDPVGGYGNLYVNSSAWKALAQSLKDEKAKGGRALYNAQYQRNPYLKEMLNYWADPTPEVAEKTAQPIIDFAHSYLDTLVNGGGVFNTRTLYFMGAQGMSAYVTWMDILLASPDLSAATKVKLKQAAALFGTALWDNDVSPMQANSGMNLGPANMAAMWNGTRYTYALFLSNHPNFKPHVDEVLKQATYLLHNYINEAGACDASAHYTEATMVPILNLLQQLQMRGVADVFATDPLVAKYAEWEMQLTTPPEVRFGGLRKIIAVGDGATEQNVRLGQLGTGLAKGLPQLSARVMGTWKAMGDPQDNFYGPSILKVDPSLPAVSPNLGDAHFEGWMSVMRSGWDTKDESAVFFVNGDSLTDHRHNDNGEVVLYALGAPLSLDFGSMYYPRPDGGLMHSIALPEASLGRPWDADHVPLSAAAGAAGRSSWWNTVTQPFVSLPDSASASAHFTALGGKADMQWQRTVRYLHPDNAAPVILLDDEFSGKDLLGKPIISTLNMMAQGPVSTPAGPVTPIERTHLPANTSKSPDELPSSGTPFPLAAGLNKFSFTGQWLIDWDLYTDASVPMQAEIGNWGNTWIPNTEMGQFQISQKRPFSERQHILRLRGQDHVRTLIFPYHKGDTAAAPKVEKRGDDVVVTFKDAVLTVGADSYLYHRGQDDALTSFSAAAASGAGISIEGGPAEVSLGSTKHGTLALAGAAGRRKVELPAGWSIKAAKGVSNANGNWQIDYAGGAPVTLQLVAR